VRSLAARVAVIAAVVVFCSAHVGSPDAWYEGNAGPYHVVVQVATPGVVPGVANVFARIAGAGVEQVTVQANRFDALAAAPPPEIAEPVEGDPGLYAAPLWIMSGGSNSVTVNVRGSLGAGKVVVPVVVVANRRLELDAKLGAALTAVGVFLFVGLITIVGAAVRESVLSPGETADASRKLKGRIAMGATAALVALALFGGSRWWNLEDSRFNRGIYKPLAATATIVPGSDGEMLNLRISDSAWTMRNDSAWIRTHSVGRWSPLIPDHGKLVHLFMIREPDLLAFAHLHPSTTDTLSFPSILPALPPGRYRVYGDIVHESGFAQTLSTKVELAEPIRPNARTTDADDASHYAAAVPNGTTAILEDGSVMTLEGSANFVEGKDASLRFTVVGKDGKPLALEPYIGMAGHAVVSRDDGAVFVHLHPSGTISMASQLAFTMRQPGDTVAGRLGQRIKASEAAHPVAIIPQGGVISFPYAFPKPGKYHMWVQVKHGGRILTGAFAFVVRPAQA
jgi:hypothetical protein